MVNFYDIEFSQEAVATKDCNHFKTLKKVVTVTYAERVEKK